MNVKNDESANYTSRRLFLHSLGMGVAALGMSQFGCSKGKKSDQQKSAVSPIQGFDETSDDQDAYKGWVSLSDRKIRMGIVGYGVCQFGAQFGFQNHPNVEIVAVSDLFPDRCDELAKACKCSKKYPSLEELVKDKSIEAVFVATDAPSHMRHCLEVLKHGKHVASAVPAVFGSLEDADRLLDAVKASGLKYMMFETSNFHEDLHAMRQIYNAGELGKLVYAEGEYYHYMEKPIDSYKKWRVGLPPQFYPTHSNAYYVCVTGESFTEVSCLGIPSEIEQLQPGNNRYKNPFGTEIALFRTSEGGMARMGVSWDTPGDSGEKGRIRGQKGSFYGKYEGLGNKLPELKRPPLPPGLPLGGHGGSHGYLCNEFIASILQDRKPMVDITMALNLTAAGIVAHQSALKDGELMKIPQYKI
jgi:predicted dehydrogenase